ncbi:hypothetical protein NHQ30_002023 [Ciborinia camelliae]|nr:hypothetical protein NHQ30_002023 [Ciborinia camelliae]
MSRVHYTNFFRYSNWRDQRAQAATTSIRLAYSVDIATKMAYMTQGNVSYPNMKQFFPVKIPGGKAPVNDLGAQQYTANRLVVPSDHFHIPSKTCGEGYSILEAFSVSMIHPWKYNQCNITVRPVLDARGSEQEVSRAIRQLHQLLSLCKTTGLIPNYKRLGIESISPSLLTAIPETALQTILDIRHHILQLVLYSCKFQQSSDICHWKRVSL